MRSLVSKPGVRLAVFVAAMLAAVGPLQAGDHEQDDGDELATPAFRRSIGRLPRNSLDSLGVLFSQNAAAAIVGVTLTGASLDLDDPVRREVRGNDLGGLRDFGDRLGDSEVVAPLTLGLFAAGRVAGRGRFRDMTYDLLQAQLLVSVVGLTSKEIAHRERPNHGRRAFPSGHSYSW